MIYSEANSRLLSNNNLSVISFMCHAQSQAGSALKLNCKDLYESICQVLMPISRVAEIVETFFATIHRKCVENGLQLNKHVIIEDIEGHQAT